MEMKTRWLKKNLKKVQAGGIFREEMSHVPQNHSQFPQGGGHECALQMSRQWRHFTLKNPQAWTPCWGEDKGKRGIDVGWCQLLAGL